MGRAAWCDAPEAGHAFNELQAIMVAGRQATLFFCPRHQESIFATALNVARKEGKCGISVPTMGDFQILSEAAPDDSAQPQPAQKQRR